MGMFLRSNFGQAPKAAALNTSGSVAGIMENTPSAFSELMNRRAKAREFMPWFQAAQKSNDWTEPEWLDLVVPVANAVNGLDWMSNSDRGWVQACIVSFVVYAFTKQRVPFELKSREANAPMQGFTTWMEAQPDYHVVRFCWDVMKPVGRLTPPPVSWLKRSGRLSGDISLDNIRLCIGLVDEANAMYHWEPGRWALMEWQSQSLPYSKLLDHSSYLVRAAAAKALGQLYCGIRSASESGGVPPLAEMLSAIQTREAKSPGVAGPFLDGMDFLLGIYEWGTLDGDVDMKTWFLETFKRSSREPNVPHIQSLEFYAHELFSWDPDSIREFLKMGRTYLAVLTATESPEALPKLLPVLKEMAESSDPAVSAAIREYLAEPSSHGGMQHMRED